MAESRRAATTQRRIGYHWKLRAVMATRNLWKTTDLMPLLKSRGISLSESQVYRLVTGVPERIPGRTFAALCDILDCTPNDLIEPYVELAATSGARAPEPSAVIDDPSRDTIAHRIRLTPVEDDE